MGTDLGTELTYFLGEGNFMKSICKFLRINFHNIPYFIIFSMRFKIIIKKLCYSIELFPLD